MRKSVALCLLAATLAGPALARNSAYMLNWSDVMDSPEAKQQLDGTVKFMFGDKTMPAGAERKAGDQIVSRIAKGKDRSDDITACKAAALGALVDLQQKAKQMDADAVVDVVSFYKNSTFASATQYECHAGGTGGHLTFKASFAKLRK
jgi:uncharacterized protein YbjQ (UPF0145 family)